MKSDLTFLKGIGFLILGYLTELTNDKILSIIFFIGAFIFAIVSIFQSFQKD